MADTPSNPDQTTDPLAGSPMSALGMPPAEMTQGTGVPVTPPPDAPPITRMSPTDPRLQEDDGGGKTPGRVPTEKATSRDPHWVWVTTGNIVRREAYWARYRQGIADAMEPEEGEKEEAFRERQEQALAEWDAAHDEDWLATQYQEVATFQHAAEDEDRIEFDDDGNIVSDERLYDPSLLHMAGIREAIALELEQGKVHQSKVAAALMKQAILARIAPKVSKEVLAAIEGVTFDAKSA